MNHNKDSKIKLIIKGSHANFEQVTAQTNKMRENTNNKIRELGYKYYFIKNLFERLNVKRDDLFLLGRQIENDFKEIKKVIHLQTQSKRMKESIICWYAENFFNEIIQKNSIIFQKLAKFSKNQGIQYEKKDYKQAHAKKQRIENTQINNFIYTNDTIVNQEIDTIDFLNYKTESNNSQNEYTHSVKSNFDYEKLLEF